MAEKLGGERERQNSVNQSPDGFLQKILRRAHKPKVFGGKIALKAESITDCLLKISSIIH